MTALGEAIRALYKLELEKGGARPKDLASYRKELKGLLKNGMAARSDGEYRLTPKGRKKIKVVACGGVFDILHPGHGFVLEKARSLGDFLVVVVARDSTVMKRKRIPIVPEEQRLEMVGYLKAVDVAVLGEEGDYLRIMERIRPDVIALGPDQHHDGDRIKKELEKRGLSVKVVRVKEYKEAPLHSTRDILKRIIERGYPK